MIQQKKHTISFALSFTVSLIFAINIFGQTSAQISIPFEVYDNAGGHYTLYFGLDQTATDGIDIHLVESELPPYPPTGVFEVRWFLPENNFNGSLSSWIDYRFASGFPYSNTKEHRLRFQSTGGATSIYFSWDFPPEVTGLLQDVITGNIINVPLSGSGVYELTDFIIYNQLKLLITYNNIVTGFETDQHTPKEFRLNQNYPNPFNPNTIIKYEIPASLNPSSERSPSDRAGTFKNLSLKVYDLLGKEVAVLVNQKQEPGIYEIIFNAANLSAGVYFYQLKADEFIDTKKLILLK